MVKLMVGARESLLVRRMSVYRGTELAKFHCKYVRMYQFICLHMCTHTHISA